MAEQTPLPTPSPVSRDAYTSAVEELILSSEASFSSDPKVGVRIRKRRYLMYFVLLTGLFSIGSVNVYHDEESGFLGLQRLYQRPAFFQPIDPLPRSDADLASELGVSLEELYTAENVLDRFRSQMESRQLGPLDWALRLSFFDYTIVLSYRIFLNMFISAIISGALFVRARDKAASILIDIQNRRLRELNLELAARIDEAQRYLTELRQTQSRLVQAEKLASIGRMSATLAHEIRNPLSIISSAAGMASEDLRPGSPPHEAILLVRQEIARLDSIITELLNFARPKPPNLQECSLNESVQAWAVPLYDELAKDNVRLELELGSGLGEVFVDPDQLFRVFLNVIWNARDACREQGHGRISVQTEPAGPNGVFLVVRDDGPGMDPETLSQVQEPFFTTKTHGTGLGLPVVFQLMEGMGGSAYLESELERGTTVHLLLRTVTEGQRRRLREQQAELERRAAERTPA